MDPLAIEKPATLQLLSWLQSLPSPIEYHDPSHTPSQEQTLIITTSILAIMSWWFKLGPHAQEALLKLIAEAAQASEGGEKEPCKDATKLVIAVQNAVKNLQPCTFQKGTATSCTSYRDRAKKFEIAANLKDDLEVCLKGANATVQQKEALKLAEEAVWKEKDCKTHFSTVCCDWTNFEALGQKVQDAKDAMEDAPSTAQGNKTCPSAQTAANMTTKECGVWQDLYTVWQDQADAREALNKACFKGGNPTHIAEKNIVQKHANTCKLLLDKCP